MRVYSPTSAMPVGRNLHLCSNFLLLLVAWFIPVGNSNSFHQKNFDVGVVDKLELSPSLQVVNSPGSKPGTVVLCERVFVNGLPRLKYWNKFSYALNLTLSFSAFGIRRANVEICLHRNASIGIGMPPRLCWVKVDKDSWTRVMSPFGRKILDIRVSGPSPENFELLVRQEFSPYRVVFLVLGFVLWCAALRLSRSLVFYYSSAMFVGVLLVVLVILFQGMKLLPTGRRSSLAIFLYSSLVGFGTFLLQFLPGLIQSLLVEMGISEDMHFPLATIALVCVILAGAWMGFWAIRKLVLTEDGSIDSSTSQFVAWAIRAFGCVLILQGSFDHLIAFVFLLTTIVNTEIMPRFWRRLYKATKNFFRIVFGQFHRSDLSSVGTSYENSKPNSPQKSNSWRRKGLTSGSLKSPAAYRSGMAHRSSEPNTYLSSFHSTPDRRRLSPAELSESTKKTTKQALQGLYSSPEFSSWVAANADRITVTPESTRRPEPKRRRWLIWF